MFPPVSPLSRRLIVGSSSDYFLDGRSEQDGVFVLGGHASVSEQKYNEHLRGDLALS